MTKEESGMTEQTDGSDKSDPYISEINRQDARPTDGTGLINQNPTAPFLLSPIEREEGGNIEKFAPGVV